MWRRIAKEVNIVMAVELPRRIDKNQVKHIIDVIFECVLPKVQRKNTSPATKPQNHRKATQSVLPTDYHQLST